MDNTVVEKLPFQEFPKAERLRELEEENRFQFYTETLVNCK